MSITEQNKRLKVSRVPRVQTPSAAEINKTAEAAAESEAAIIQAEVAEAVPAVTEHPHVVRRVHRSSRPLGSGSSAAVHTEVQKAVSETETKVEEVAAPVVEAVDIPEVKETVESAETPVFDAFEIPVIEETVEKVAQAAETADDEVAETTENIEAEVAETAENIEAEVAKATENIEAEVAKATENIEAEVAETTENIEAEVAKATENIEAEVAETTENIEAEVAEKKVSPALAETKVFDAASESTADESASEESADAEVAEDDNSKTEVFVAPMPTPEEYDSENFNFEPLSEFDSSLIELTPEQIDPDAAKRRSSFPLFSVIRVFLILVCLAVLGYCLFVIGKTVIDYGRTEAIYDNLAEDFFSLDDSGNSSDDSSRLTQVSIDASVPTASGATDEFVNGGGFVYVPAFAEEDNPFDADPAVMVEKLNTLKERAPDLVGWIYIEGSKINYPIVQYTDNTFYLYHSADKLSLQTGAIFQDFRNNRNFSNNYNTVLYGHNIRSGAMFHDVEKMFKNESFFRSVKVVICTFDGIYYYEPISVFKAKYTAGYNNTDYDGPQDFADYMNLWKNRSQYVNGNPVVGTDRILTLSTCTNVETDERYALMTRLTKFDPVVK